MRFWGLISFLFICGVAQAHHGETFNTLKQVPPVMPPTAYQSGFCCMTYDITPDGNVANARATYRTEHYLAEPSKAALMQWKYDTKKKDGSPVTSKGLTTFMSFVLSDELGHVLPRN